MTILGAHPWNMATLSVEMTKKMSVNTYTEVFWYSVSL